MRFPIAIETGDAGHAFGVVVPDLPGCYSAGDTLDEAITNAREAIALMLEDLIDGGEAIPEPSDLQTLHSAPDFKGWTWALVDVDLADLDDKAERVNITLPSRVLRRIDRYVAAAPETNRSAFLASAAMRALSGVDLGRDVPPKVAAKAGRAASKMTAKQVASSALTQAPTKSKGGKKASPAGAVGKRESRKAS